MKQKFFYKRNRLIKGANFSSPELLTPKPDVQ